MYIYIEQQLLYSIYYTHTDKKKKKKIKCEECALFLLSLFSKNVIFGYAILVLETVFIYLPETLLYFKEYGNERMGIARAS